MPVFTYRAVDPAGKRTRGRLSGATPAAVVRELETRGLLALEVEAASGDATAGARGRRRGVLEFTRAVAALLPAGMPLARALGAAAATSPASVRPTLDAVRRRVERGDPLASALAEHPRLFSPLYVGVVRAGERSGSLDDAFERLAGHLEREDELRSKLLSMSIYPVLLAVVGVAAILLLVFFVLPRFAELLESSGAALPRSTAAMLALVNVAREHGRWLVVLPPAALLLVAWLRTTASGRRAAAATLIRAPVIGGWRRQALGARFARILGELLAGGAPLLSALADARDCLTDPVLRDETDRVRTRVREGSPLHAAVAEGGLFPEVLPQLVSLGEEAGRLAAFLLKSADLLERKTEQALERMVALAEPLMIVAFGGVVALVALALLQAIYGVNAGAL